MAGRSINGRIRSDLTPAQNKQRRRSHSEENEIDGDLEVQDLAVGTRTGDDDRSNSL